MVIINLSRPKFSFTMTIKKFKKSWKFGVIFTSRTICSISFITDNCISFQIKEKKNILEIRNFGKNRNGKILPKNRQIGNTAKYWFNRNNVCLMWNQRPKINKVDLFQTKYIFAVDHYYLQFTGTGRAWRLKALEGLSRLYLVGQDHGPVGV